MLGYAPDRFSRNLQEGGELIQLVEQKLLALRFTNFHFENNAGGQMMLGFWFVFAEHYSKKLSEDTTRGTMKLHSEGRSGGVRKYGYAVNEEGYFVPDTFHFKILRKAFERKIYDNWSDGKIADKMNASGWSQSLQEGSSKKMTARKISENEIWKTKFYYGVFERTFNNDVVKVDLRDIETQNYVFKPLISEEEFCTIQENLSNTEHAMIKKRTTMRTKKNDPIKPIPQGMMIDEVTGKSFIHSLPNPSRYEKKLTTTKTLDSIVKPLNIKYTLQKTKFSWSDIDPEIHALLKNMKVSERDYQAYLYALKREMEDEYKREKEELSRLTLLINKESSKQERFRSDTNYRAGLNKE